MKQKFHIVTLIMLCAIALCVLGCTEKIELKTQDFEDVLVVEATITDQLKRQEIKLTRTYLLENNSPVSENNANVRIEDSNQNVYDFHDIGDGIYLSDTEFQAIEGVSYKLIIDTQDGKQYVSTEEFLPAKANIENLYAELITVGGDIGVQVFVDSNDNLGDAQFFRYEYEESYKIIAPNYITEDAIINGNNPNNYSISIVDRPIEQKICYTTKNSTKIILTNFNTLTENKISRFPIRFIRQDNSVLRERYSILVKQYVQSANANNFYRILEDFSKDASLLLDNQPGFIKGNIVSQQSEQEKVVGYFDISSVTEKRIYFNYLDFDIDKPPYFYSCEIEDLYINITQPVNEREMLFERLFYGNYKLAVRYELFTNKYSVVVTPCGDCTSFSSNIIPDFWEE